MFQLPETFRRNVHEAWEEEEEKWIKELPAIIEECKEQWELTLEPHAYDLSYNFIAPVRTKDNQKAILKIGFPKEKEVLTEIESLRYFPGKYSVRILEHNVKLRAFIVERLTPGTSLRETHLKNDPEATQIALPLLRGIPVNVPKNHKFPSLADWAKVFERVRNMNVKGTITHSILDQAQRTFEKLDATKKEEKLLHGDLHHDNILCDEKRGWIAIDPKGVIGDPSFNGSRFIINNWSDRPTDELLQLRVTMIAKALGYDEARIAGWAYVDYIISNCWTLEGTGMSKIDLSFAQALESLMNTGSSSGNV
ncbi:MAG: aminoglycoside phosphotransferase family protein [Patescibacteria group bacterium]